MPRQQSCLSIHGSGSDRRGGYLRRTRPSRHHPGHQHAVVTIKELDRLVESAGFTRLPTDSLFLAEYQ
ncbi:MAG: hypothetical protein DLM61_04835 [Pseudonocardiales bacterium]|nr:MAG: hypothetical protein DLM61_04835 [Pseudonocardiales bacterium]